MEEKEKEGSVCTCWAREGRVMTPREEMILAEIRVLKERHDYIRECLSKTTNFEEKVKLEEELSNIRRQRENLEKERLEAAKERMKLLGHE